MLAYFGAGQYRPAATEAHAVASLGKLPGWTTVHGIWGDDSGYKRQLEVLEQFTEKNPSLADARFLLGALYAIEDYNGYAQVEFLAALKATPHDPVAAKLFAMVTEAAMRQGGYVDAIRLATDATIEQPRNQNLHLLLMLAYFERRAVPACGDRGTCGCQPRQAAGLDDSRRDIRRLRQ